MFPLDGASYGSLESSQGISLTQSDDPQTLDRSIPSVETAHTGSQTTVIGLSDLRDKSLKKITSMMEKKPVLRRGLYGLFDRYWPTFQSQGLFALASSSTVPSETSEQSRRIATICQGLGSYWKNL